MSYEFHAGQAIQDADEQPEIRVHDEILVGVEAVEGERYEDQKGVPENYKGDGKENGAAKLDDDAPRGKYNGKTHNDPENQADDADLHNNFAVAAFDSDVHGRSIGEEWRHGYWIMAEGEGLRK
jgi:hypothetical protein